VQLPLSCSERDSLAVIAAAREACGASAIAYNVLAQGFFSGKYSSQSSFHGSDLRARSSLFRGEWLERNERLLEALREVAQRHGVGPAQVAVRWALERPNVACALVGIKTEAQAKENSASAALRLDPEDWQRVEAAYHSDFPVDSRQGSS
jgi:aryl-alcohol dehydrogenase-like predicted oxidoreductase